MMTRDSYVSWFKKAYPLFESHPFLVIVSPKETPRYYLCHSFTDLHEVCLGCLAVHLRQGYYESMTIEQREMITRVLTERDGWKAVWIIATRSSKGCEYEQVEWKEFNDRTQQA